MPWKEMCTMGIREEFVAWAMAPDPTVPALCREPVPGLWPPDRCANVDRAPTAFGRDRTFATESPEAETNDERSDMAGAREQASSDLE